jgi:hypothetical protein
MVRPCVAVCRADEPREPPKDPRKESDEEGPHPAGSRAGRSAWRSSPRSPALPWPSPYHHPPPAPASSRRSARGQAIEVANNPALGFRASSLRGDGAGHYYGRFPITNPVSPGQSIEVINNSDRPVTHKTRAMVDVVRITKLRYDSDARTLTVEAHSSDGSATGPAMTVQGFGPLSNSPFTGVNAPPAAITVTSAAGGSATAVPTGTGAFFLPAAPVAGASADTPAVLGQTVQRGRAVALDGSRSTTAGSYSWRQISGPAVTLSGAGTAKPTFTYPLQLLPASPGPNPTYIFTNDPVVLELTVRNPAGISTDQVAIRPQADGFNGLTVRYRTSNNEWRIAGRTNLIAGQRVSAVLGSTLTGRVIGTPATTDATGAFAIRATGPAPGTIRTVSLVTTTGGVTLAFPATVTN